MHRGEAIAIGVSSNNLNNLAYLPGKGARGDDRGWVGHVLGDADLGTKGGVHEIKHYRTSLLHPLRSFTINVVLRRFATTLEGQTAAVYVNPA